MKKPNEEFQKMGGEGGSKNVWTFSKKINANSADNADNPDNANNVDNADNADNADNGNNADNADNVDNVDSIDDTDSAFFIILLERHQTYSLYLPNTIWQPFEATIRPWTGSHIFSDLIVIRIMVYPDNTNNAENAYNLYNCTTQTIWTNTLPCGHFLK